MKFWCLVQFGSLNPSINSQTNYPFYRMQVDGESVHLSRYVLGFVWFHPLTLQYHVHEATSGAFLADGPTKQEAREAAIRRMVRTGEHTFFDNISKFGAVGDHPVIPYTEAMDKLREWLMKKHVPEWNRRG